MPKSNEISNHGVPNTPDAKGYRHFGDGIAGRIHANRVQGWSSAAADYVDVAVDASGVVQTSAGGSAAWNFAGVSTVTRVATSTASAQLLALTGGRKGALIYNDSTGKLYVKFGTTASLTDFTFRLDPGGIYEMTVVYTGRIDARLDAGTGNAQITELT